MSHRPVRLCSHSLQELPAESTWNQKGYSKYFPSALRVGISEVCVEIGEGNGIGIGVSPCSQMQGIVFLLNLPTKELSDQEGEGETCA